MAKDLANSKSLDVIVKSLANENIVNTDLEEFKYALFNGGTYYTLAGRSKTYIELLSSGGLALLESRDLRDALSNYDDIINKSETGFLHIRSMQTVYIKDFTKYFTRHPTKRISFNPKIKNFPRYNSDLEDYDFNGMVNDRAFRDAAEELREMQAFYALWQKNSIDLITKVCEQLGL